MSYTLYLLLIPAWSASDTVDYLSIYYLIRKFSLNLYNFYFYNLCEYQTPWTFGFFRKSTLFGTNLLRERGSFHALYTIEGLQNCPAYYWTSGEHFNALIEILWINGSLHEINYIRASNQCVPPIFKIDGGGKPFLDFLCPNISLRT